MPSTIDSVAGLIKLVAGHVFHGRDAELAELVEDRDTPAAAAGGRQASLLVAEIKGSLTKGSGIGRETVLAISKNRGLALRKSFVEEACATLKSSGQHDKIIKAVAAEAAVAVEAAAVAAKAAVDKAEAQAKAKPTPAAKATQRGDLMPSCIDATAGLIALVATLVFSGDDVELAKLVGENRPADGGTPNESQTTVGQVKASLGTDKGVGRKLILAINKQRGTEARKSFVEEACAVLDHSGEHDKIIKKIAGEFEEKARQDAEEARAEADRAVLA